MADFTAFLNNINDQSNYESNSSIMDIQFSTHHNNFFYNHHPENFPANLTENFPGNLEEIFPEFVDQKFLPTAPGSDRDQSNCASKKRKASELSESSSAISEASQSGINNNNNNKRRNSSSRGKGVMKEDEKPRDVVHVRARRGQATDSHSLAERVRRGKINERLKCLQDIVPGCYKTMGMAVMLDEIINYVQSLQNQVEFLSMKLAAASSYYDFNSEVNAIETIQKAKAQEEVEEIDKLMRGAYGVGLSCFHSTWSL